MRTTNSCSELRCDTAPEAAWCHNTSLFAQVCGALKDSSGLLASSCCGGTLVKQQHTAAAPRVHFCDRRLAEHWSVPGSSPC